MHGSADQSGAASPSGSQTPQRRKFGWVIAPILIFGVLVAVFAFALQTGDPSKLPSALIGRPVPQISYEPLEGFLDAGRPVPGFGAADLSNGKVSVVNFWASWCTACIEEHAQLMALRKRGGVQLFGVDYKDQAIAGRRFLGRYGNPFDAVGVDPAGRSAIEWGVYGMPETFIVNGKGEIVYKHVGPITPASLEEKVLPAIASAKSELSTPAQ